VFLADERCVSLENADSNFKALKEELLDHLPMPVARVYTLNPVLDPAQAAIEYEASLRACCGDGAWPELDLMLLGMGEDGHTCSLFPGHPLLTTTGSDWIAPIYDSPKAPPERITFTLPAVNSSKGICFVCTGAGKQGALRDIFGPSPSLPAGLVSSVSSVEFFVDETAAASLES
jgi:6-phosphogluconolactonase